MQKSYVGGLVAAAFVAGASVSSAVGNKQVPVTEPAVAKVVEVKANTQQNKSGARPMLSRDSRARVVASKMTPEERAKRLEMARKNRELYRASYKKK